jgi:anti-anti-sigma factor
VSEEPQKVHIEERDGVTCIHFPAPHALQVTEVEQTGEQIRQVLERSETRKIVMSLVNVEDFLPSALLGLLITARHRARERGGGLRLCCVSPRVREILSVSNMENLFEYKDDVESAVAALRSSDDDGENVAARA